MLSLAMIVRNESGLLGHCLDSVQDLVDEIVVVDTGSTDDTIAQAQERGAIISHFAWCDDFSVARNKSLRLCTGDWILILDADEAIDRVDHQIILAACDLGEADVYELTMRNYSFSSANTINGETATNNNSQYLEGREFPFYTDSRKLRLCRNIPGLAFKGRVHEQLTPFIEENRLSLGSISAVIHHYGKTLEEREAYKRGYYLKIASRDAGENQNDYQCWFALMHQAMSASNWGIAIEASLVCERLRPGVFDPLVVLVAGVAYQATGDHARAIERFDNYLAHCPGHAPLLTARAMSHFLTGQTDLARRGLKEAIASQPDYSLAYINLSEYEAAVGNSTEALRSLQEGLATLPADPALYNALSKLLVKLTNR